jgi:biotin synthase
MIRHDWTVDSLLELYSLPMPELLFRSQQVHRQFFPDGTVQRATLLSVKTGKCSEDCSYCAQSAKYKTEIEEHRLLPLEAVIEAGQQALAAGSTRLCMGAAWRQVKTNQDFDRVLEMVREVSSMGLEVCCTLGMVTEDQAIRLKEAGCHSYNHNLDTSPEYYPEVITTHTYEERLETLRNIRKAGIQICSGGIIGLGESVEDRLSMLCQLATQDPHPENVPLNMLVKIAGTPLENQEPVDPFEFVRIVALARITMPASMVRLSAGRNHMNDEMQALCFCAGANSIHTGPRLLTTDNRGADYDELLIDRLGLRFEKAKEPKQQELINSQVSP